MLNIMNPPADWSTMKKLIWLRGTPINGGEDLTVSGTPPLTLPNSLGKPLKAWSVDLLPYQEGTGDPSPSNVRPIHGMDKVNLWTSGKNLFGGTFNEFYPLHFDTDITVIASASTPATTGSTPQISFYNVNQTRIDYWGMTQNISQVSGRIASATFTLPKESYYIKFIGAECSEYMLEFGSANTEYVPFTVAPSQTVITLPQTVYTATISEQGGESRSEEIDLATIDSTRWRFGKALSDGTGYYVHITGTVNNPTTIISDRYVRALVGTWEALSFGQFMATTYLIITVPNECNTLESAKDYLLNTNKPQFVMSLSTPTTFVVPSVTIPTPSGTATAWATAEDGTVESMEVTYVGKA